MNGGGNMSLDNAKDFQYYGPFEIGTPG